MKSSETALPRREEQDFLGSKTMPGEVYYGIQTMRAFENFRITGLAMHDEIINSLAAVKMAAARANYAAGVLCAEKARAIETACLEIRQGRLHDQFIVDPIQGGAGTSLNMNANEVIANRAIELLGGQKGDYQLVHPNDDVNQGQSTNDVVPTAGKITALILLQQVRAELLRLQAALQAKAAEFQDVFKMGRTQLQDAVPIRLGQEFGAWASAVERDRRRMETARQELCALNLGGTAVGTGLNAHAEYRRSVVPILNDITGLGLTVADNLIDSTQNLDAFVAVSGAIKACAVTLSKMASDLRLLSSGPRCGLGEINLPPRQNGSSIMPGKVNPVIPEVVNQVAFNIIGNDVTITLAAESGQLELNAFEPIVLYCLFQSIDTLGYAVSTFVDHCITGITANAAHCRAQVENSIGIITALCPRLGYARAAALAKQAECSGTSIRAVLLQEQALSEAELEAMLDISLMA